MKQVLAALVAIALIGGAWFVRTEVIEGGDGVAGQPGSADDGDTGGGGGTGTVLCDAVLGDACPAGAEVDDVAGILARLGGTEDRPDVLIAPDAVTEMVAQAQGAPVAFGEPEPLATTLMALVTFTDGTRTAAADPCGADPTWACVADAVGVGGGALELGLHDPAGTTDGVVAFGVLTAGFLTERGLPVSNAGLSATSEYLTWFGGLQDAARTGPAPVTDIVRFNGAMTNAAVVTEAEALAVTRSAAAADRLEVRHPTPLAALTVVAVGVDGADVGDAADGVAEALAADGWRPADGSPPADAPALPDDPGLPSGGFLVSLQSRW